MADEMTGKEVNAIVMDGAGVRHGDINAVSAVIGDMRDAENLVGNDVSAVVVDSEDTGRNLSMFL